MMYKISNNLVAIDSSHFLYLQNTSTRGHGMMYTQPYSRTQTLNHSSPLPSTSGTSHAHFGCLQDQISYRQPLNYYMPVYHFKAHITLPQTCTNSLWWYYASILRPYLTHEEEVISTKDVRAMCVVIFIEASNECIGHKKKDV